MGLFLQVKDFHSLGTHLLEFFIAGLIFTSLVFFGLYIFDFRIESNHSRNIPKEIKGNFTKSPPNKKIASDEPIITTPLPSQDELIRQLINANRQPKKNDTPRTLAPWEKQIRDITRQPIPAQEKTRRLISLAQTLTGEEQSRAYAAATALAPVGMFQQQLYPMVWNPNTPAPVTRVLATGVVTQPDSFKFPALLALLKHSDEDTRAMAESVLWAYFPDEPTNNYPQAVQKYLAGSY